MSEIKMTQTQRLLLQILSHALKQETFLLPQDTDLAALYKESRQQAVAPMVYSAMSAELCNDPQTLAQWKNYTMCAIQHNLRVHQDHVSLHKLLSKNGIDYCIIKGTASALDYPDPLLRAMGDVDFLVLDAQWEHARTCLLERIPSTLTNQNQPLFLPPQRQVPPPPQITA
ncbi:MAG: nucleotidyltransferase family protein [Oscillospiraceae bacterium]|nr:nucleotidyltransferase family protein [Oscillospiraceae bacterium]